MSNCADCHRWRRNQRRNFCRCRHGNSCCYRFWSQTTFRRRKECCDAFRSLMFGWRSNLTIGCHWKNGKCACCPHLNLNCGSRSCRNCDSRCYRKNDCCRNSGCAKTPNYGRCWSGRRKRRNANCAKRTSNYVRPRCYSFSPRRGGAPRQPTTPAQALHLLFAESSSQWHYSGKGTRKGHYFFKGYLYRSGQVFNSANLEHAHLFSNAKASVGEQFLIIGDN